MATNKFDELNNLSSYDEYFDVMEISNEQKLERIELAELLDDVFLFLFLYMDAEIKSGKFDLENAYDLAIRRYTDALEEYGIDFNKYPDIEDYAINMAKNLVDSTVRGDKEDANKDYRDSGIGSDTGNDSTGVADRNIQRAINVAQNESNSVFNRVEYDNAINNGFKYKTWITEGDSKVRSTHSDVDNEEIPIDDFFVVGESKMMFPKDLSLGASVREVAGCRCSIRYTK